MISRVWIGNLRQHSARRGRTPQHSPLPGNPHQPQPSPGSAQSGERARRTHSSHTPLGWQGRSVVRVIVGYSRIGEEWITGQGGEVTIDQQPVPLCETVQSKHSRPRAPPLPLLPPQRAPLFLLPQSRRREHCESKWVSMRWRGVGCQWANRHFHAKLIVHLATLFLAPSFASPPAFGPIHHPSHSFLFISTIASLIACAHTQSLVLYSRRDKVRDEAGEKAGGLLLLLNGGSGGLLCHVVGGHFGSGGGDLGFVEREDVVVVERRGIPAKVIGSSAFT